MTKAHDLVGKTFGRWTVITPHEDPRPGTYWLCVCACGKSKVISGCILVAGDSKSCGCLARENASAIHRIHGMEKSRTYKSWVSMKERCDNPRAPNYHRYGGRGITYCEKWATFTSFLADMGERPAERTLGRIDNNGNYGPENCRWETVSEQQRNKRNTKLSMDIARQIRRDASGGKRKYLIARDLGITFSNVKDVLANRCWVE